MTKKLGNPTKFAPATKMKSTRIILAVSVLIALFGFIVRSGVAQGTRYYFIEWQYHPAAHKQLVLSSVFKGDSATLKEAWVYTQFEEELMLQSCEMAQQGKGLLRSQKLHIFNNREEAQVERAKLVAEQQAKRVSMLDIVFDYHGYDHGLELRTDPNYQPLIKMEELEPSLREELAMAVSDLDYARRMLMQEKRIKNRLQTARNGWIEKHPGDCRAGGPPPICPKDHWVRSDSTTAKKAFQDYIDSELAEHIKGVKALQEEAEAYLAQKRKEEEAKPRIADNKADLQAVKYFFVKAYNNKQRKAVVGDVLAGSQEAYNLKAGVETFMTKMKVEQPELYYSKNETIVELSFAFDSKAEAMSHRRNYLAEYHCSYAFQPIQLSTAHP